MFDTNLEYYKHCFARFNLNKLGGKMAPHKPLLLLAIQVIIQRFESIVIIQDRDF